MNQDNPRKIILVSIVAIALVGVGSIFFSKVASHNRDAALVKAADYKHTDQALALIEAGANVNAHDDRFAMTPLHAAAASGNDVLIQALLQHGANVNATDKHGETPLFYAALRGHASATKILLAHGANTHVRNMFGRTPLQEAQGPLRLHHISAAERANQTQTVAVLQGAEAQPTPATH